MSVLWRTWRVSLADGTLLMHLPPAQVAENPGARVRGSELYRVLRAAAAPRITFGTRLVAAGYSARYPGKLFIEARRGRERIACEDVDLLVAGDGRYSEVRKDLCGLPSIRHLGVAIFQLLVPGACGELIDDYEQWFNGPNRLLAFRVPDGAVYVAGSFPIAEGGPVPEGARNPDALRAFYTPRAHRPSPACQWIIDALCASAGQIRRPGHRNAAQAAAAVPGKAAPALLRRAGGDLNSGISAEWGDYLSAGAGRTGANCTLASRSILPPGRKGVWR